MKYILYMGKHQRYKTFKLNLLFAEKFVFILKYYGTLKANAAHVVVTNLAVETNSS